ncbi:PREDICTED: PLAT domain-containing protein 3-like [Nelumbo nucifera]|uniref:PLAT domain-containing protein 3-like n=2 Tax=Nelumbo nucifera TaxID=4432 RepID=A0A1U8B100_NELNU|nr:PREDICTED: PLAT domain-containing protein 3-like [Nelumbo nucifera]DAD21921.1 TPA_asm: hypothetical protein HUJ06_023384 [Nelumbo nucifera]
MATNLHVHPLFLLCFLFSLAIIAQSSEKDCVYTVYVRTGKIIKGGTDSVISLELYNANESYVSIPNLEKWGGIMKSGHNYFERGNLDIFSGRGRCLSNPVCAMKLSSDGSGSHHGWYCNYVEVTSTGPLYKCSQQLFTVEQWLALDTEPYQLTTFRSNCPTPTPTKVATN